MNAIRTSEHGSIYVVGLDVGKEVYLVRAEFRKLRDNEV